MSRKGFTLIELVMVIVIIGILAVIAIPRFLDLADDAKRAAEQGTVGGVRAGIYSYYAKNQAFPTGLGTGFDAVLSTAATDWTGGPLNYVGPHEGEYTYNPADGSFTCTDNCP